MSKLVINQENPIDRICYEFSECVSDAFHKTGHTPNVVTTYSAICGGGAIFAMYNGFTAMFAILMTLAFFFDCLDGYMARKYKQTSRFGDLYDHIKDTLVIIGIFYVVAVKFPYHYKQFFLIMVMLKIPLAIHTGCQQQQLVGKSPPLDETQDAYKVLCPDKRYINLTRWFGCGTYNFILIISVVILMENYKRI